MRFMTSLDKVLDATLSLISNATNYFVGLLYTVKKHCRYLVLEKVAVCKTWELLQIAGTTGKNDMISEF